MQNYSNDLKNTIEKSKSFALNFDRPNVCLDTLFHAVLYSKSSSVAAIFNSLGTSISEIAMISEFVMFAKNPSKNPSNKLSKDVRDVISQAEDVAKEFGADYCGIECLIVALIRYKKKTGVFKNLDDEEESISDMVLDRTEDFILDVHYVKLVEEKPEEEKSDERDYADMFVKNDILSEFAENLNEKASKGMFDNLINHDPDKIVEIATTLCRKKKANVILVGDGGAGKCLGHGTKVLMFDGSFKEVQDIVVGDFVMGADSSPRKVLSLGRGQDEMFKIKQNKGIDYIVNSEHILSLRESGGERIVNIPVKDYINKSEGFKDSLRGWKTGVEFEHKDVSLDPYFLGLWLGDGTSTKAEITNQDPEVLEYLKNFAEGRDVKMKPQGKIRYLFANPNEYRVEKLCSKTGCVLEKFDSKQDAVKSIKYEKESSDKRRGEGCISMSAKTGKKRLGYNWNLEKKGKITELKEMSLYKNKHIPDKYKYNSREVRLELLAGILDSDGSLTRNCFDIAQKNERLMDDIIFVARSLGFNAEKKLKVATMKRKDGTVYRCDVFRTCISGHTDEIPTKIKRKKAGPRKQIKNVLNTGIVVEPIGRGDYYGFELDGDHLFLLEDFTVTHNSSYVELLAKMIVDGTAPEHLLEKVIYSVDLSRMVAGTEFRGMFEKRLTEFVEEAKKYENIILFFDEIHALVGAGGSGRKNDLEASNILKPPLARGEISCIGATTQEEYIAKIKNDSALDRRFHRVVISEPSKFKMKTILPKLAEYYEEAHDVIFTESFLDELMDRCEKFLPNKKYPDKAIDILDTIGARAKMRLQAQPSYLKEAEAELLEMTNNVDKENLSGEEIREKVEKIQKACLQWEDDYSLSDKTVSVEELDSFFENKKRMMLRKAFVNLPDFLTDDRKKLGKEIISKLNDKESSILLYGPKDSGKTFMCRAFSDFVRSNEVDVIHFSGLDFSPAELFKRVVSCDSCVVIIDDLSLISNDGIRILSKIIKDKKIERISGEIIDFSNVDFILTCGVKTASKVGFGNKDDKFDPEINEDLKKCLKNSFQIEQVV